MKKRRFVIMVLVLAMVLCFGGCGSKSDGDTTEPEIPSNEVSTLETNEQENSKACEHLYIGTNGTAAFFGNFDPNGSFSVPGIVSYGTAYLVYDQLFYANADGEYVSRIVDSYTWADDTTLEITLKDNIYFSNGDQLMADDVLYSLAKRQQGIRPDFYKKFNVEKSTANGLNLTLVADAPYAPYMSALDFNIGNKDFLETLDPETVDWYDPANIVGSGPYVVTDFIQNSEMTFELRDDYWGSAYGYTFDVEAYTVYAYSDQNTLAIELESGAIDLAFDISVTDYDRFAEMDNMGTGTVHGGVNFTLFFDSNNNVYLKDAVVREAICHALDVSAIGESAYGSYANIADSIFTSKELGYVGGLTYDYDPEYAKQLLEEAGYEDGEIVLNYVIYSASPNDALAETIMGYLDNVGITVNIEYMERMTYFSSTRNPGVTDLYVYVVGTGNAGGEPAIHLDDVKSTNGHAVMARNYDDLIISAEQTLDNSERESIYGELQEQFYENFDGVPLFEFVNGYAYNTDVISNIDYLGGGASAVWLFDIEF